MLSRLLILCVRAYQTALAPLIGPCCRFTPSCSEYCIGAIRTHGPWRGLWLACRRLLRCHPFGPCGYDPVPLRTASGAPPPHETRNRNL